MYPDGGGLYLQVTGESRKSWIYRYTMAGHTREMGLGAFHTIGLAEARQRATECRKLRMDGIDPIGAREAARAKAKLEIASVVTFNAAAETYITSHEAGWKGRKQGPQWRSSLKAYAVPVLGGLSVQDIDVGHVMKVLEPIWSTKPETASRVRSRIEAVLDWAKARGHRTGENPARWRGHLGNLLPARSKVRKVVHHPALPYAQIAAFVAALRQQEGISPAALEFLILTATRTSETIGARWDELNLDAKVWTIPSERMKANREHRVPLSLGALDVVERMKALREGDFIFPGGKEKRPLSNMALLTLLERMGRSDITSHGFRSTFRDWTAEQTEFHPDVAEMALAHTIRDKVEAAYRRGDLFDKRRELMDAWARYVAQ